MLQFGQAMISPCWVLLQEYLSQFLVLNLLVLFKKIFKYMLCFFFYFICISATTQTEATWYPSQWKILLKSLSSLPPSSVQRRKQKPARGRRRTQPLARQVLLCAGFSSIFPTFLINTPLFAGPPRASRGASRVVCLRRAESDRPAWETFAFFHPPLRVCLSSHKSTRALLCILRSFPSLSI